MRHLLQTRVLLWATLAAMASTLVSYPRFLLWANKNVPVEFLVVSIFVCAIVLWAFVFAWHGNYTRRPVFWVKWDFKVFTAVTLVGLVSGAAWYFWLDPVLKQAMPGEFPADWQHWLASTLFSLGFSQLFLTFAPFDWWMRLCRDQKASIILTALFNVGIVALKWDAKDATLSTELLIILLSAKFTGALLVAVFYLRGGMALAWWWSFLLETRHLVGFF